MTMHKLKIAIVSAAQKVDIRAEGKQAFTEGQRRGYNPYTAHNLAFAVIWWNGWDTAEEESNGVRLSKKKP
jgi:hypothetical protein